MKKAVEAICTPDVKKYETLIPMDSTLRGLSVPRLQTHWYRELGNER